MSESETRADIKVVAGRYQLVSELGRGGMGTVWAADDTLTGRKVALKVLRPQQGSSDEDRETHLRRSLQEARSAARISHPNAVTLYDVIPSSNDDDAIYLIMELVDGPTLTGMVMGQGGTLPAPLVARFGLQLVDVLEAAHDLGIVHRDIKPGNILIARGDQAKLTDFGIAHLVGGTRLTRAGTAGTLSFMAPELFQGQEISAANDIWSLGTTLFYAADGTVPFDRDNDAATMAAILSQEVPAPNCDPVLAQAISGMLIRDPGQRFTIPRVREILGPLAAQAGTGTGSPAASPPPWAPPTSPPPAAPGTPTPAPAPRNPLPWLRKQQQPVPSSQISDVPAAPNAPAGAQTGASGQDATTGVPQAPPAPLTAAAPQRQGQVAWDEGAQTGLANRPPTNYVPTPGPQPPAPAPKSGFSRKTLIITASAALVVAVAGTVVGIFLSKSGGGGPLSLANTLNNPGNIPATALAFSPDSSTLATTDNAHAAAVGQNSAGLWDTAAGAETKTFPYAGIGYGLAFSSDGSKLAIAGADTYVYNVASRAPVDYIANVSPQALAWGQGGSTLAVGGRWTATSSENVELLNPATRQWTATMPGVGKNAYISAMAFAPNGTTLAATDTSNGTLDVWNTASRSQVTSPVPLASPAGPLAFSHDGSTLAVATGGTGSVRLWNVSGKSWSSTTLTDAGSKGVKGIAYSPDGTTLAVADANGTVNLWNTSTGKLIVSKQVSPKGVDSVTFSPDGKALATGDGAGHIELWAVGS